MATNIDFIVKNGLQAAGSVRADGANHAFGGQAVSLDSGVLIYPTFTGSAAVRATSIGGALTVPANATGYGIDVGNHYTLTLNKAASGTHSDFATAVFKAPTIGAGAATLTNASTLKIIDAPTVATNNYALWVAGADNPANALAASSVVLTSNVVTVTFTAHGYITGQTVFLYGFTSPDTVFNATHTITGVTANTFTFALVNANLTNTTAGFVRLATGRNSFYSSGTATNLFAGPIQSTRTSGHLIGAGDWYGAVNIGLAVGGTITGVAGLGVTGFSVSGTYVPAVGMSATIQENGGSISKAASGTHNYLVGSDFYLNVGAGASTVTTVATLRIATPTGATGTNTFTLKTGGGRAQHGGSIQNSFNTDGLTLHQGTSLNENLSLQATDVAHGITNAAATNTYFAARMNSSTTGGVYMASFSSGAGSAFIDATVGVDTTTKTASSSAAHMMGVAKKNGVGLQAPASTQNLLTIMDSVSFGNRFIFDNAATMTMLDGTANMLVGGGKIMLATGNDLKFYTNSDLVSTNERMRISATGVVSYQGGISEKKATLAAGSGSTNMNIDLDTGTYFSKTISGASTFTLTNIAASGQTAAFVLDLTNGGSAAITWFSGIKWPGGTAPTLTAAGRDALSFFTYDAGTTWSGLVLGKDIK